MATKAKKSTKKKATPAKTVSTVTHIKASDSAPSKPVTLAVTPQTKARTKRASAVSAKSVFAPLIAAGTYFKGAWYELRQVSWPNRKETWSLTAAVMIFSAFFIVLIVLLDALFKYLFELILK